MRDGVLLAEDEPSKIIEKHGCSGMEDVFIKLSYRQETETPVVGLVANISL